MRRLSVVEAALGLSLLGSLAATGIPAFLRNLHASRLSEATEGLARISARAAAFAEAAPRGDYPETAPLTPEVVPAGTLASDPPGAWEHPTWQALDFRFEHPHAYSFEFVNVPREADTQPARYRAHARGDLDADGQQSRFTISGEHRVGRAAVTYPLEMHREVE